MNQEADVVVVGMGPGGEEVAGSLAEAGLDVVGIESELLGGECPYWGCVPSKMIIRGADLLAEARRVPGMSGAASVSPDWAPIAKRIRKEATDTWDDKVAVDRFVGKGGRFLRGQGRLVGTHEVAVGDTTVRAGRAVVLATGTVPVIPQIPGLHNVPYWTNRDVIKMATLPTTLTILGGGAIGVEFAQALARFGVTVTVVEGAERIVPAEEPESSDALLKVLQDDGVVVKVGVRAERVSTTGGDIDVHLSDGGVVSGERLLVAVGRKPRLEGLGLEHVGVPADAHSIPVDGHMRVGEGVWAVGDCTGKGAFTHIAMYQARIAAAAIQGKPVADAAYHALPRVTFTDPEIGSVGLTEIAAREAGITVRTGTAQVSSSARGWIHGPGNAGYIKIVEDAGTGVLVGATSMGPWGGEVMSMLVLAVQARVPTDELRRMIYAYPTFHRGIEDALRDL